jgi:hypothetical protein
MSAIAPVPTAAIPHAERAAPAPLWREARRFLLMLYALFGAPSEIAGLSVVRLVEYQRLAQWLRCAEAMLRRLLLIEAAALPKPNLRPLLRPQRKRVRQLRYFSPERPDAWRVGFRVLQAPRAPRQRLPQYGPRKPYKRVSREDLWSPERFKPVKLRSIWPLAERFEALIRVYVNPAPYARRLARRLYATPHRCVEALEAPPEAAHRIAHFEAMGDEAQTAWRERRSSA